jgi:hypothetical protein
VTTPGIPERSYGCTFGCGNPYDFILISVRDGTTEFLCLPDMVRLATDMVEAVTNPDGDQVAKWNATVDNYVAAPMSGNGVKKGRRNAPATNDDPDLFESFDSVITTEELPEAFQ